MLFSRTKNIRTLLQNTLQINPDFLNLDKSLKSNISKVKNNFATKKKKIIELHS